MSFIKALCWLIIFSSQIFAQEPPSTNLEKSDPSDKELEAPAKVTVNPKVNDQEISQRLRNILEATGWFHEPRVEVRDGIVFLYGNTKNVEFKEWAKNLASNTEEAIAVVNQIQVVDTTIWDFSPFIQGLHEQWKSLLRTIPALIFGLIILVVTWIIAKGVVFLSHLFLRRQIDNPLLLRVIIWGIGTGIILIGLYSVFRLMGLTTVALTVVGGTGLLGIVLGIAFKEITENLLASIFLSVNNPFHKGDLIEIEGITGYVQNLNIRSTILLNLEGNYIQIPNARVYQSNIRNYTSNPNRREDFLIGIGYNNAISEAQEIALKILNEHPTVLKDPEPWVLVDSLDKSAVNLRVYFWLDGSKHSWLKVRSSVIRLIKRAFQAEGISMPDEQRERIFPEGINVWMHSQEKNEIPPSSNSLNFLKNETKRAATEGEGELHSEAQSLQDQSRKSDVPEKGENLLKTSQLD